jgi:hypothetical protein
MVILFPFWLPVHNNAETHLTSYQNNEHVEMVAAKPLRLGRLSFVIDFPFKYYEKGSIRSSAKFVLWLKIDLIKIENS